MTVFDRTTIINNYTAGSNNRTVVNLGPGANAIAAVSRSEIRKVTLRDVNPSGGTLIKSDRLERDGTLAVFRPQLPKQASAPPPEITRRQQELRTKTETLVKSDVVRLARADAERKTTIAPATRGSARAEFSQLQGPLTGEARRSIKETDSNAIESTTRAPAQPALSRNPRSELRNSGQSSPLLVKPSRQEREARPTVEVAPRTFDSRRPESNGRSVAIQPEQRPQPQLRPQPNSRPAGVPEERPQFNDHPPPANPPSFRQESRRVESRAPASSAPPAIARSPAQSITPPPTVIQPRLPDRRASSPAYRPPQNNLSPPSAAAPRVTQAPTIRPSSPAPSYSPPPTVSRPSSPPVVSRPQPAPSSPPPASRPSSPPSQSRGESRKN